MMLLCKTSLSSHYYQKDTYKCTASNNRPLILNCASFHDRPKGNIAHVLHQKMSLTRSKFFYPSSPFRGNKMICQSSERPATLDTTMAERLRPYMMLGRFDHRAGFWLIAWPSCWAIALATSPGAMPSIKWLALLVSISILLRTSGCTINDLHDIEFDKQVERCKTRPLASGELSPVQGWFFWGFQLLLLIPLFLQLNSLSLALAAAQQILIFIYPLMKRVTYLPQAFLSITVNWSALIGWTAVTGSFDTNAILPLYIGGVFWTFIYDTIYAHQDKKDDAKAGVKSSALLFGNSTIYWNLGFAAVCIASLVIGGYNANLGWPFYPFIIAAAIQLFWQIVTVDLSDPSDCNRKFVSNKWFGALVFMGIALGRLPA